jgi:hypothetical protein
VAFREDGFQQWAEANRLYGALERRPSHFGIYILMVGYFDHLPTD